MGLSEEQERALLQNMATRIGALSAETADSKKIKAFFTDRLGSAAAVAKGTEAEPLGDLLGSLVVDALRRGDFVPPGITAVQEQVFYESLHATLRDKLQGFIGMQDDDVGSFLDIFFQRIQSKILGNSPALLGRVLGFELSIAVIRSRLGQLT